MKGINSLAARTLTIVGIVLILAVLLDYLVLLLPPGDYGRQWQIARATEFVDRGIVPLVGLGFLLTGSWLSAQAERGALKGIQIARVASLVLASLLGLLFLLIVPLHINNVRMAQTDAVKRIEEEASNAQKSVGNVVATQLEQERQRIQLLLQNDKLLTQAISSQAIKGEQVALLQKFKDNPKEIDSYLTDTSKKEQERLKSEIDTRLQKAKQDAAATGFQTGLRTGISSLLLAVGYAFVGWTGLKEIR